MQTLSTAYELFCMQSMKAYRFAMSYNQLLLIPLCMYVCAYTFQINSPVINNVHAYICSTWASPFLLPLCVTPLFPQVYVHRSGRTARAQEEGLSVMLVGPKDLKYYRQICRQLNKGAHGGRGHVCVCVSVCLSVCLCVLGICKLCMYVCHMLPVTLK